MPTWIDEWTVLYVIVLTMGYIAIFTLLDRYNRRKRDTHSAESSERQQ